MIFFRIKTGYYLELLTPETMKLIRRTNSRITKDENGEDVPRLEITEETSPCNIVNNNYPQNSRVLYNTFAHNNFLVQLLDISPKNFMFLKTFDSEFSYIEVWFADRNYTPLEIEDKK